MASQITPEVTVCVITASRPELLDAMLASLAAQENPPHLQVLVGADDDPGVAGVVGRHFPDALVVDLEGGHPGALRNVLIDKAAGELVVFLDDDVVVRPDLLCRLAELGRRLPHVDVFGGPNETPAHATDFEIVQGAALASLLGSGPVRRRYGSHPPGSADERYFTLCNLAVRRRVLVPFEADLLCAEENALLAELARRGSRMHYDPDLVVYHERRPTWSSFARQMFKYGRGRGQVLRRRPSEVRPAFLVPSALVLALTGLVGTRRTRRLAAVAAVLEGAVLAGAGSRIALTLRKPRTAGAAAACVATIHLAYGSGVLRGLADPVRR